MITAKTQILCRGILLCLFKEVRITKNEVMNEIINKIKQSGIITLDLLTLKPAKGNIMYFDIKQFLKQGYFFQEKEFRTAIGQWDWTPYAGKMVSIGCSNDAIFPYWVYLFIAAKLKQQTRYINFSQIVNNELSWWKQAVIELDMAPFENEKVVLKARNDVPPEIYIDAAVRLLDHVKSLMWGEAGSPIMIFKI